MKTSATSFSNRLAVCSWSLQPTDPADLLQKLAETGLKRVQLALDPLRKDPEKWSQTPEMLRAQGFAIVSGMVGCVGEDYTSMETIRLTGGIAPDQTWEENLRNMRASAALAQKLGLKLVTFHAGFVPANTQDPAYEKMKGRLVQVAETFDAHGLAVGFETGQETAAELDHLLRDLGRPNAGVNFDPANMIMYDKGDPVKSLALLAPWIRQVHIKDAKRTSVSGKWGQETPAGEGEVDWPAFFRVLQEKGLNVDLAIEREQGGRRLGDIRAAKALVEKITAQE